MCAALNSKLHSPLDSTQNRALGFIDKKKNNSSFLMGISSLSTDPTNPAVLLQPSQDSSADKEAVARYRILPTGSCPGPPVSSGDTFWAVYLYPDVETEQGWVMELSGFGTDSLFLRVHLMKDH